MPLQSQAPSVTEKQRTLLSEVISGRTEQRDHITRATIIMLAANGKTDPEIAKTLRVHRQTAGKWRRRWNENLEKLALFDEKETGIAYKRCILSMLSDMQRPGAPCKFTPEEICKIVHLACEKPEDIGLPLSHWSLTSLAKECVNRNIVENISRSQLAVFLKSGSDKTSQS